MAKRSVKTETKDNEDVLQGGPGGLQHGDVITEEEEEEEEPDAPPAKRAPEQPTDPLEALRAELEAQRAELAAMRAQTKPAPAPAKKTEPEPEPEPDWEDLLYKNPKEFVKQHGQRVREEVTRELRGEYQAVRGEEAFWNRFYVEHKDLAEDDDLVRATLARHQADLGDLPVEIAAKRLADLTRERILRYAGGGKPQTQRKKAVAEGANPPKSERKVEEEPKVVTLSQLIRDRKARRAAGGKATAA